MSFLWICVSIAMVVAIVILFWFIFIKNNDQSLSNAINSISNDLYDIAFSPQVMDPHTPINWVSFYLASDHAWKGKKILEILSKYELSIDADGLFSYTVEEHKWFSVAQATYPVTFDLSTIESSMVIGLAFFMDTGNAAMPRVVFNKMIEVMKSIAVELNGNLVDKNKKPIKDADLKHILNELKNDILN